MKYMIPNQTYAVIYNGTKQIRAIPTPIQKHMLQLEQSQTYHVETQVHLKI